jgi:hypothetical protein
MQRGRAGSRSSGRDVLGNECSEMPLAERDDPRQTLAAARPDEALGESIQIRASGWQPHTLVVQTFQSAGFTCASGACSFPGLVRVIGTR